MSLEVAGLAVETNESGTAKQSLLKCGDLEQSLGYTLRRAQLSIYQEFTAAMTTFDIRPSQYAVLSLIQSNPGLTQSTISGTLGVQKANLVALLDRLVERGLAERRKVTGDRRSSALHLTNEGKSFVRKIMSVHHKLERNLASRLGKQKNELLLALLQEFCRQEPSS